jgi:hypothetical protein
MSTAFTPDAGSFFYVEVLPYDRVIGGGLFGGEATVIKQRDRSYGTDVFLCTARDDRMVVGKCATPSYSDGPRLFLRRECAFFPVGPDVVNALGLSHDMPSQEPAK